MLRKTMCRQKFGYTLPIVARDSFDQGEDPKIIRNFKALHCNNGYSIPNHMNPDELDAQLLYHM